MGHLPRHRGQQSSLALQLLVDLHSCRDEVRDGQQDSNQESDADSQQDDVWSPPLNWAWPTPVVVPRHWFGHRLTSLHEARHDYPNPVSHTHRLVECQPSIRPANYCHMVA